MRLERENDSTKWYRDRGLRIKLRQFGKRSEIWVTLDRYNICRILMLYDVIERARAELLLELSAHKTASGQRVFEVDSDNASEFVYYLSDFVHEWGIRTSPRTVSDSDRIPDECFYA